MSHVVAIRRDDRLRLEVDVDAALVEGDAGEVSVKYTEVLFLYYLVSVFPKVLRHSKIESDILTPNGIGLPPSDPRMYIRKLKLTADRTIQAATGQRDLIVSVRGLGYKLAGHWDLYLPEASISRKRIVVLIRQLAEEAVTAMHETPLVDRGDGTLVLERKEAGSSALYNRFVEYARLAAREVSIPVEMLEDIGSYLQFRREGRVPEEVWKALFARELSAKVDLLCRLLAD